METGTLNHEGIAGMEVMESCEQPLTEKMMNEQRGPSAQN
jgi:hypothetical protein